MRTDHGEPYALKKINEEDMSWDIFFDPTPKLDGFFYYEKLNGFIDGENADMIVDLLNEKNKKDDVRNWKMKTLY